MKELQRAKWIQWIKSLFWKKWSIWFFLVVLLFGTWASCLNGPTSFLVFVFLIGGTILFLGRNAWIPFLILLCLNPLGFFFLQGTYEYFTGAPRLRFHGLPCLESFNLDRKLRCFRSVGGCVVHGNEWVSEGFHNLAIYLWIALLGPPVKSYTGPYPTKEECLHLLESLPHIPLKPFLKEGKVQMQGKVVILDPSVVQKLLVGLRICYFPDELDDLDSNEVVVQATIYQTRCLILRFLQKDFINPQKYVKDIIVLFDLQTKRPFAYYQNYSDERVRYPPVSYLPQWDF